MHRSVSYARGKQGARFFGVFEVGEKYTEETMVEMIFGRQEENVCDKI